MRATQITTAVTRLTAKVVDASVAAIGVDAVDVAGLERDIDFAGGALLDSIYLPAELAHCAGDPAKLASRFAAKEAALKVLGTGIRGIGPRDVEVKTSQQGEPTLHLSRAAREVACRRNLGSLHCSMTHEAGLALAIVVAEPAHKLEQT